MYLDPGFGSMIIQLIVAGIAACGAYLFVFKNRIKKLFKRGQTEEEQSAEEQSEDKDQP